MNKHVKAGLQTLLLVGILGSMIFANVVMFPNGEAVEPTMVVFIALMIGTVIQLIAVSIKNDASADTFFYNHPYITTLTGITGFIGIMVGGVYLMMWLIGLKYGLQIFFGLLVVGGIASVYDMFVTRITHIENVKKSSEEAQEKSDETV